MRYKCGLYLSPTGYIYELKTLRQYSWYGESAKRLIGSGMILQYKKTNQRGYHSFFVSNASLRVLLDGYEYLGKL